MRMKIAIGCDEAGYKLKEVIRDFVGNKGHQVQDVGVFDESPVLYPDYAVKVAMLVAKGDCSRGILICGTGIGMCISANKVPGIRAAVCHDPYSAQRARMSNVAQILCLGARVVGAELAKTLTDIWLRCEFAGGGSTEKVERMNYYDKRFRK